MPYGCHESRCHEKGVKVLVRIDLNVSAPPYLFPMSTKRCPYCTSDTGIRIILYGMPSEEPDPAIYTIGGCCISDDMPKYECIECGWKGLKTLRGINCLKKGKAIANKD